MDEYSVQYNNSDFSKQRVELDGKYFNHCQFKDCIIILEKGETSLNGCTFENCKLMLRGNAYTIGKIIKLFTRQGPLKVLDIDEPLLEQS